MRVSNLPDSYSVCGYTYSVPVLHFLEDFRQHEWSRIMHSSWFAAWVAQVWLALMHLLFIHRWVMILWNYCIVFPPGNQTAIQINSGSQWWSTYTQIGKGIVLQYTILQNDFMCANHVLSRVRDWKLMWSVWIWQRMPSLFRCIYYVMSLIIILISACLCLITENR